MNLLFLVPSYKPAYVYGGTTVVIATLAEQLVLEGHNVSVYTTTANGKEELGVTPGKEIVVDGVKVTYFKRITGDHTHISPDLWRKLYSHVKHFDVVHIHSWWNPLVMGAAWICRYRGVKPVFSPHGMLSSYIIETNNAGKKKILHHVAGKPLLKNSWIHITAESEMEEALKIIPEWKGIVIPNLVQLSTKQYERHTIKIFTIGFISRIDPKKGLDLLIKALAKVNFDYKLVIAGDGNEEYIQQLKELAAEMKIEHKLEWVGWKMEEEKFGFLTQLDLFALTSHNENFAVAVIESLSVGTPVLISDAVGLQKYVEQRDFGWITNTSVENITMTLNKIHKETEKLAIIRSTSPDKIREEFDHSFLAREYANFYLTTVENRVYNRKHQIIQFMKRSVMKKVIRQSINTNKGC